MSVLRRWTVTYLLLICS